MIHFKSVCCVLFVSCLTVFSTLSAQEADNGLEELTAYLTPAERVRMLKAEELIRTGESEVVSGEHYASRKPSKLNPDEDVKAIRKRGEEMIASGRAKIDEGKRILAELKENALAQKKVVIANRIKEYRYQIDRSELDEALKSASIEVLKSTWEQNYDILLFDGLFITDAEGTRAADSTVRNRIYDMLVEIDGTNFSISVPIALSLEVSPDDGGFDFVFENQGAFSGKRGALLAMEMLVAEGEPEALLVISAIDLDSKQLAAQSLRAITNPAAALEQDEGATAEDVSTSPSSIPESASLTDQRDILTAMAGLGAEYVFRVDSSKAGSEFKTMTLKALLGSLILKETGLTLLDIGYVGRAYYQSGAEVVGEASDDETGEMEEASAANGEADEMAARPPLLDGSNAILALFPEDTSHSFLLRAKAIELNSVVDIGSFTVNYPSSEPTAQAATTK